MSGDVLEAGQLVRYDAMCRAIAAAYAVDEVKDIRDKALAIETYSRLAQDTEQERRACEIRLRAERRAGQLLAAMKKAKGGQPSENPSHATRGSPKTLSGLGISYDQSSRWQKTAAIPEAEFEATLAAPGKPSTTGLIAAHQQRTEPAEAARAAVDPKALWLWGRLLDFKRDGLLAVEPDAVCATMLDHMRETVRELAPLVADWLRRISL